MRKRVVEYLFKWDCIFPVITFIINVSHTNIYLRVYLFREMLLGI
ncbi:hypothetical protein TKV_c03700 [Thermoanaerobacter kivui]|uniref:Uncharacterized protein n=2 Tax=Thermoanaerobacter TaxID=1754 RepID=A0A097AP10_THEKI|nr:hypothetical protein TKV_c03700 [Thermoanaerobacter kivui]MDP9749854.1 hypothetical protein [Thermoanaerobacter pentosaceus]